MSTLRVDEVPGTGDPRSTDHDQVRLVSKTPSDYTTPVYRWFMSHGPTTPPLDFLVSDVGEGDGTFDATRPLLPSLP